MNISKLIFVLSLTAYICVSPQSSAAQMDTAAIRIMPPSINQYLVSKAPEFQTLVSALHAADLMETINSTGPLTVFAPLNVAFTDLPFGGIDELLKPVNKDSLQHLLSIHIIAGTWSIEKLEQAIKEKGGELSLPTIDGTKMLIFTTAGSQVFLNDRAGNKMALSVPATCTNGLVFSIYKLLSP
jgi:uncharacterized surface protein with fasciclin (FAS1) repeats